MSPTITCTSCQHFHQFPQEQCAIVPGNYGECRERVHLIPTTGLSLLRAIPYYPVLPEDWAACGQYKEA